MEIIKVAFLALALVVPARSEDAGNALWITDSGLVVGKSDAAGVAKADILASVINGNGYSPSGYNKSIVVGFYDATGQFHDKVDVPVATVSPGSVGNAGGVSHCDEFGNCSTNTPAQTHWDGSYGTLVKLNGSPLNCDAPPSNPVTTIDCPAGQIMVGSISGCDTNSFLASNNAPWYKPNWCNCGGSCAPGSPGCPFSSGSPCVNSAHPGDGSTDCFQTWRIVACAAPNATATSAPFPNATPGNPAGSFQPAPIPSGDISARSAMLSAFSSALTKLSSMSQPANNTSGPVASAVTIINNAINYINNGPALSAGQYAYAPGVVPCSTCTALATSSGALSNVYVTNPEINVHVDNFPATSTTVVNVNLSSMTIGDGAVLGISSATVYQSTDTFQGVYNQFVIDRGSNSLFSAIAGLGVAFSTAGISTTFDTNLCLPTQFGTFCKNIDDGGYWSAFVGLMYWAVQAAALVAGYFIIYG